MKRGGSTFSTLFDEPRLDRQHDRVLQVMRDGAWRTLFEIATITRQMFGAIDTEAAVSARLRDFRKPQYGAYTVERRRRTPGLHEYRVVRPAP